MPEGRDDRQRRGPVRRPSSSWPTSGRSSLLRDLLVRRARPALPRQPRRRAGSWPAGCSRPIGRITGVATRDPGHRPLAPHRPPRTARRAQGARRHVRRHARPARRRLREPAPVHPRGVARAAQPAGGDPHQPRRGPGRPDADPETCARTAEVVQRSVERMVAPRRRPPRLRPPGCVARESRDRSTSATSSPT